ncbi:helix-turn-helix domain-containing protein [Nocardioides sp. KC13]|uniref:citrate synthase (unknown stereospecificity) n=1 Tax=Nocardioides turkmenicus TaxID=2711220 RepID=A0A6M1QRE4_9ACTN|nr:helix-turn-helix domain-containing protein [Nocardioides sp. KC13]
MTEWITTREAAQRLGVKRTTLYTYVSRSLLTRRRSGGESLFDRAEIDALASTRHHPGSPLGVLPMRSVRSNVSEVREGELFLRGVPLADLADEPLDEVVDLVLGPAPAVAVEVPDHLAELPLVRRLPALALWAGSRGDWVEPGAAAGAAKGLLGAAPRALGGAAPAPDQPVVDTIFAAVAGRRGSPREVATLNTALVALLDHGLAASVVAARVAASARASAYDCLVAGYAALSGRLHGAIGPSALAVLRDGPPADPSRPVPGFGHWRHPEGDPRADAILARLALVNGSAPALARLDEIASRTDRRPNVDGALAALVLTCELPETAAEVFFQVGRTVGLAAHVVEESEEDPLRWRATDPTT